MQHSVNLLNNFVNKKSRVSQLTTITTLDDSVHASTIGKRMSNISKT